MLTLGIFVLRVFVGLQVAAHGSQKLFGWFGGHGLEGTGGYFESIGFRPGKHFTLGAALGEFVGGLLLAFGFLTPLGCAAIIAVMITAMFAVHVDKGFFAQDGGYELPLLIAVASAALAFTGPGPVSLDNAFGFNFARPGFAVAAILVGLCGSLAAFAARASLRHRGTQRATV